MELAHGEAHGRSSSHDACSCDDFCRGSPAMNLKKKKSPTAGDEMIYSPNPSERPSSCGV